MSTSPREVGLGPAVARARVLVHEVLNRGAHAVAGGNARCASQLFNRCAQADARVLGLGAQATARGAARCSSRYLIC
jgi:hypothetical protein